MIDPSIERTVLSAITLIGGGALLWHFGFSTESVALIGPVWGAVVGFWFGASGTAAAAIAARQAAK